MVSTDDRAEDVVNKEPQGIARPPGSALVGQIPDGSQHLLQGAVVCQRDEHPGGGQGGGGERGGGRGDKVQILNN